MFNKSLFVQNSFIAEGGKISFGCRVGQQCIGNFGNFHFLPYCNSRKGNQKVFVMESLLKVKHEFSGDNVSFPVQE